jgi:hypothetical protein
MIKKITILAVLVLSFTMSGCLRIIQLKNKYTTEPISRIYDRSLDSTWQATMNAIVMKNMSVHLVERESGLISSFQTSYIDNTTYENLEGTDILHKNAYIVTHRPNFNNDKFIMKHRHASRTPSFPFSVLTGRWKIQVLPISKDKTEVRVILGGFEYMGNHSVPHYPEIYTLKNFENEILNEIAKQLD